MHKCQALLSRLHVFDGAEQGLKGALSQVLQPVVFVQGDYIIQEGDAADAMYFISTGKVDIIRGKHRPNGAEETRIATLGPGSFFGEVSMVSKTMRAVASALTMDHMTGYALSYDEFQRLAKSYPSFKAWIESVVRLRLANTQAGERIVAPNAPKATSDKRYRRRRTTKINAEINVQTLIDVNDRGPDVSWRNSIVRFSRSACSLTRSSKNSTSEDPQATSGGRVSEVTNAIRNSFARHSRGSAMFRGSWKSNRIAPHAFRRAGSTGACRPHGSTTQHLEEASSQESMVRGMASHKVLARGPSALSLQAASSRSSAQGVSGGMNQPSLLSRDIGEHPKSS